MYRRDSFIIVALMAIVISFLGCSQLSLGFADLNNKSSDGERTRMTNVNLQATLVTSGTTPKVRLEWTPYPEPITEAYSILLSRQSAWGEFVNAYVAWPDYDGSTVEEDFGLPFNPGDTYYFRLEFQVDEVRMGTELDPTWYLSEPVAVEVPR